MTIIARVAMIQESIVADVPPEAVWRVFSRLETWPAWNPIFSRAETVSGRLWEVGSTFRFSVKPWWLTMNVKATVVESDPPRQIVWTGRGPGVFGQHSFTFEPDDGGTRITTSEVFGGPLQWTMGLYAPQKRLRSLFIQWLQALKAEAERRA